jgi:hypothetical protein
MILDSPAVASAILCDSLPVHAPPALGLARGRPVQLLRLGPLFDQGTGDRLLDVTDELCAAVALAASGAGFSVPIDHGHALYRAQASGGGGDVPLYGRLVELEHRPGSGLWGTPEWTDAGAAMLAASPGLLYLSPTLLGQPHDPRTGAPMPGRILHSVSLTPTPRQDTTDSVALSRPVTEARSAGTQEGAALADPNPDVVTLARVDHVSLLARVTDAEKRATEADAKAVQLQADLTNRETEATSLAARVDALDADRKARDFADLLRTHDARGVVVSPELRVTLASLPAESAGVILANMPATRAVAALGHGGTVPDPKPKTELEEAAAAHVLMSATPGLSFMDAIKLARKVG